MKRIPFSLILLFPLALIVACSVTAAPSEREALVERIGERFDDPDFAQSFWGVLIESLDSGEIWYERNADRLFIPASNQKIPVAAAAYRALGPDFTFTTTVHHTGDIQDGVLRGDLVIHANGDPTLYDRLQSHPTAVFERWAAELRELGIRRIEGNLVGDDSAWERRRTGSGWPHHEITPWYYAEYGPLQFNENYVDLRFIPPASVDGELVIQPNVESAYFTLVNKVRVVERGSTSIAMNRPPFSNEITLSGTVVAGAAPFERTPTITDPTLFYVTVLKETLEANGIAVDGVPVGLGSLLDWPHQADDLPEIARHDSPPLREIIPSFMKRSQNVYAETLVLTMGWKETGFGTFAAGREVVQREMAAFGVRSGDYRFADGSGLSRYNLISPRQINAINRGMRDSELRDLWLDSQAVAGVDGTLRRISRDSPLANNVRAKTGTLSTVRALSGFLHTADGEALLFSIINNGSLRGSRAVDEVSHNVLEMLATHGVEN